jgi:hypothetical protein
MKTGIAVATLALATLGLSSSVMADTVKSDYNHHANFSAIHTYSWGRVKTADPLYAERIKREVNTELQAKGWQMVQSGGDTTIFATGQVKDEKQLETEYNDFGPGWGGGWGWGGWGWGGGGMGESTTTTNEQPVANVVIDIFMSNDKHLLWRGIIQRDVSNNSEKNVKDLDKDIAKLLKDFPPKSKG